MKHYTPLTQAERYPIYALNKAGHKQTEIAMILGCHKSTIRREFRRNTGLRGYRPQQAQHVTEERRQTKVKPSIPQSLWQQVERLRREDWSPEQISLWLKANYGVSISHEWIYQYILQDKAKDGDLYRHLRCQKQRRKRYGNYSRRGQLIDRVSIDERPAIVSLTERQSRYTLIQKVTRKTAQCVSHAIIRLLLPLSDKVHTLTSDNGKEFAEHKTLADKLKANFYFAPPYACWERGLNENTSGLIRQYFPKNRDFSTITQKEVNQVMHKLNNRPRICLGIKTPNQVFLNINPPVALAS